MSTEAMRKALETIERWELPATGKFWDAEKTRPVSYAAEYGSNGEQEYMRAVARAALAAPQAQPEQTVDEQAAPAAVMSATDEMRAAVRWAPSSAYWSERLREFFGPDARDGINALERRIAELNAAQPEQEISASEALYAFAAWLTCADGSITFGSRHVATQAADLVQAFSQSQGLAEPRENWSDLLKPYPGAPAAQPEQAAQAQAVAVVRYMTTGGNVGIAWRAVPTDSAPLLPEGTKLYTAPAPAQRRARTMFSNVGNEGPAR